MKFVKKVDEMEMYINVKSMRAAWLVETVLLVVWLLFATSKSENYATIILLIILVQNTTYFIAKIVYSNKMINK